MEIHRLLKLDQDSDLSLSHPSGLPGTSLSVPGLPVFDSEAEAKHTTEEPTEHHPESMVDHTFNKTPHDESLKQINWLKKIKQFLVYPLIFVVTFGVFYSVFNFSALSAQVSGWFTKPQAQEILGASNGAYYEWIGGYYFAVGDYKLLEPTNDIDKDGLSNMDEFLIRTNPTLVDSDNDGFSDGVEAINRYNPWGEGPMTKQQLASLAETDLNLINNRISFNASGSAINSTPAVAAANKISVNSSIPGKLSIPKLQLQVPLIWSLDPANFDKDLTKGVIHYPGTVMPGETGVAYISGHSSDYWWKKNQYAQVFTRLNQLSTGDDIFVELTDSSGKIYAYRYQVTSSKIYAPDDQTQFIDNSGIKLNLSTCWPIGTQKDRLVVSSILAPL